MLPSESISEAERLGELRWLERLAFGLVRDPDVALDLSQEVLLAAEQRERLSREHRRPWLVRTLRNLASKAQRAKARRPRYEREGARAETLPSACELAARAEVQRELLRHLGALAESYRTPILLRYYEGASVAEIAQRLDLPVRTVHTRLYRGMAQLRERMDAEHSEGSGWVHALWLGEPPLAPNADGATANDIARAHRTGSTASAASTRLSGWIPGACAAVVLTCGLGLVAWSESSRPETLTVQRPELSRGSESELPSLPLHPDRTREIAPELPVTEARLSTADVPIGDTSFDGTVLGWNGQPVVGARVEACEFRGIRFPEGEDLPLSVVTGPSILAVTTGPEGRFVLPELPNALLRATSAGSVCAVAARWDPSPASPSLDASRPFLVVAPAVPFARTVVDGRGRPLVGVQAWVVFDETVPARFDRSFEGHQSMHWSATSDGLGRLIFPAVPDVDEALLLLHRADLGQRTWRLLEAPEELGFHTGDFGWVHGRVVDGDGLPLNRALVGATGSTFRTSTDSTGSFRLPHEPELESLWVASPELAPRSFDLRDRSPGDRYVGELVLSSPSSALWGTVVDEVGRPLPHLDVWIEDPTWIGSRDRSLALEFVAAGAAGDHHSIETDPKGGFRLGGLRSDREYRVRVLDPESARWEAYGPFDPTTIEPLTLEFAQGGLIKLGGRVLNEEGLPVAGATVGVQGPGLDIGRAQTFAHGASTVTDVDGRFVITRVPREGVWLRVDHPSIAMKVRPVEEFTNGADWIVARFAKLEIELDPHRANLAGPWSVEFFGADGQPRRACRSVGLGRREHARVPLDVGWSTFLEIPVDVAFLVLRQGPVERVRKPLLLVPGETLQLIL